MADVVADLDQAPVLHALADGTFDVGDEYGLKIVSPFEGLGGRRPRQGVEIERAALHLLLPLSAGEAALAALLLEGLDHGRAGLPDAQRQVFAAKPPARRIVIDRPQHLRPLGRLKRRMREQAVRRGGADQELQLGFGGAGLRHAGLTRRHRGEVPAKGTLPVRAG